MRRTWLPAGRNYGFLRSLRVEAIENRYPPLGVVEHQTFQTQCIAYDQGDLFALVTDGFTEVANRAGVEFGLAGVERLLAANAGQPLERIHAILRDAVRQHGPQTDDQTLLLVRAR